VNHFSFLPFFCFDFERDPTGSAVWSFFFPPSDLPPLFFPSSCVFCTFSTFVAAPQRPISLISPLLPSPPAPALAETSLVNFKRTLLFLTSSFRRIPDPPFDHLSHVFPFEGSLWFWPPPSFSLPPALNVVHPSSSPLTASPSSPSAFFKPWFAPSPPFSPYIR